MQHLVMTGARKKTKSKSLGKLTAFQVLLAKRVSKAVTDGPRKDRGAGTPGNGCSNEHF